MYPLCTYAQKKDSKAFISQDETVQATIGVSYLSGEGGKRGSAILTDKRLYYFGKMFTGKGMNTNGFIEEGVVSADEISFTRFIHRNPIGYLFSGIFIIVLGFFSIITGISGDEPGILIAGFATLPISLILFLWYYINRGTILEIAFPGGSFMIDSKWHSAANMREFQRQIHLVKDSLEAGQKGKKSENVEVSQ